VNKILLFAYCAWYKTKLKHTALLQTYLNLRLIIIYIALNVHPYNTNNAYDTLLGAPSAAQNIAKNPENRSITKEKQDTSFYIYDAIYNINQKYNTIP